MSQLRLPVPVVVAAMAVASTVLVAFAVSRSSTVAPADPLSAQPPLSRPVAPAVQAPPTAWLTLHSALARARQDHRPILLLFASAPAQDDALPADLQKCASTLYFARLDPPDLSSEAPGDGVPTGRRGQQTQIDTAQWAQRLDVQSVPQAVLLDDNSLPCLRRQLVSESQLNSDAVTCMIGGLQRRDQHLTAARTATSDEARAQSLHQALLEVADFQLFYRDTIEQVVKLDPKGQLGLKPKYLPTLAQIDIDRDIQERVYPLIDAANYPAAISAIDELITRWGPESKKLGVLYVFKGQLLCSSNQKDQAREAFAQARRYVDPGSPEATQVEAAIRQTMDPAP